MDNTSLVWANVQKEDQKPPSHRLGRIDRQRQSLEWKGYGQKNFFFSKNIRGEYDSTEERPANRLRTATTYALEKET